MLSKLKNNILQVSISILIALYTFGLLGIITKFQPIDFLSLTPLNLVANVFLLLINFKNATTKLYFLFICIIIVGFFIEVVGVNTGLIFGSYHYDGTLGWKLLQTPIIIGVNWLLLTTAVVYSLCKWIKNKIWLSIASAFTLLFLDILIEPVAMKYGFWSWLANDVPIRNYVAWFFISLIFCYTITFFKGSSSNKFAIYILSIQFIFFGIFNILIWI
jgi:bisanhydrobacterioruberin hydratase